MTQTPQVPRIPHTYLFTRIKMENMNPKKLNPGPKTPVPRTSTQKPQTHNITHNTWGTNENRDDPSVSFLVWFRDETKMGMKLMPFIKIVNIFM